MMPHIPTVSTDVIMGVACAVGEIDKQDDPAVYFIKCVAAATDAANGQVGLAWSALTRMERMAALVEATPALKRQTQRYPDGSVLYPSEFLLVAGRVPMTLADSIEPAVFLSELEAVRVEAAAV